MAVEGSQGEVEAQEWVRSLVGRRVLKFCVGAGLELHVDGSDFPVLTIECPLRLGVDGDAVEPTSLDVLAFLKTNLLREVLRAEQSHGTLRLGFDDGADLSVEPHPLYEAWQMCNDAGLLIVACQAASSRYGRRDEVPCARVTSVSQDWPGTAEHPTTRRTIG